MNTKKVDSGDKGVKAGGVAKIIVSRDGVDRIFISTDLHMFPSSLRIDHKRESVVLRYLGSPSDGFYEWDSGFHVFYTDPKGVEHSTRQGRISLLVSENKHKQDGSFNVYFIDVNSRFRVGGFFNAHDELGEAKKP